MRHTIDHLLIGDRLTRLMAERGLCAVGLVALVIFMCIWIAINF